MEETFLDLPSHHVPSEPVSALLLLLWGGGRQHPREMVVTADSCALMAGVARPCAPGTVTGQRVASGRACQAQAVSLTTDHAARLPTSARGSASEIFLVGSWLHCRLHGMILAGHVSLEVML